MNVRYPQARSASRPKKIMMGQTKLSTLSAFTVRLISVMPHEVVGQEYSGADDQ
jgi:hypothetical protein